MCMIAITGQNCIKSFYIYSLKVFQFSYEVHGGDFSSRCLYFDQSIMTTNEYTEICIVLIMIFLN